MAAAYTVSASEVTITFRVTGISSGTSVRFFIRLYSDTSDTTVDDYVSATGTTLSVTYTEDDGLEANTKYAVNVQISGSWLGSSSVTTGYEETLPQDYELLIDDVSESWDGSVCTLTVDYTNSYSTRYYISVYYGGECLDYARTGTSSGSVELEIDFSSYTNSGYYRLYFYISDSREGEDDYYDSYTYRVYWEGLTRYYFSWAWSALRTSAPSSNSPISAGDSLSTYLTATKWTLLQECINNVRQCAGYDAYSFTTASSRTTYFTTVESDMEVKAVYYNQCIVAITEVSGASSSSYTVSTGDTVTATLMNRLQSLLNNISV